MCSSGMPEDHTFPGEGQDLDPAVVDRVLANETTPDDERYLDAWRAMHPDAALDLTRLRTAFQRHRDHVTFTDGVEAVTRVARGIDVAGRTSRSSVHRGLRIGRWVQLVGAAVILLALAVVGPRMPWPNRARRASTPAGYAHVFQTAPGQRASVPLENGGRAILGPATRLRIVGSSSELVATVQGQVLFTIAHTPSQAFVVHTTTSTTRVLGTTFFVRQYDSDRDARIAVVEGRVAFGGVSQRSDHAVLGARTGAVVSDSGQLTTTPNISTDDYTSWTTGVLVFHATAAQEVVADVGRTYGVDIKIDSTLGSHPLTWKVDATNKSLSEALDELTILLDAHVVKTDHDITLVRGRMPARNPLTPRHMFKPEAQYGR